MHTHTNYYSWGFALFMALSTFGVKEAKASEKANVTTELNLSNKNAEAFFADGGEIRSSQGLNTVITITGDGKADVVTFENTSTSTDDYIYLITDEAGNILTTEQSSHDFEGASVGICKVYGLSYTGRLNLGGKNVKDANLSSGQFSVSSNSIIIDRREEIAVDGGTLKGGPYNFTVDGTPDMVSGIKLNGKVGSNFTFIITDDQGKILGLPPTISAVEGVNFDGAGVGTCFILHISYEDGLRGLAADNTISDLNGVFDLSNSITVVRQSPSTGINGGTLKGGPYSFCVDGTPDMVSDITLSRNSGDKSSFIITDDRGQILGTPPTLDAVKGVNFDGAGAGTCFIYHVAYSNIRFLEAGRFLRSLKGNFSLSNSIQVDRIAPDGGRIIGGPFNFTVDGKPDRVRNIRTSGASGSNSSWIITNEEGIILGLPKTAKALRSVNFDEAGPGTCLIWHISYESGLSGLQPTKNVSNLKGCFDLSESVKVLRTSNSSRNRRNRRARKELIDNNVTTTELLADFKVYPQPASTSLTVDFEKNITTELIVLKINDMLGHEVMTKIVQKSNKDVNLDVSALQSGMYLMTLQNQQTGYTSIKQIIINK